MLKLGTLVAAMAISVGAQAAIVVSWETGSDGTQYDGNAGGYVNDDPVTSFYTGWATEGVRSIQIGNNVAPAWTNLSKTFLGTIPPLAVYGTIATVDVRVVRTAEGTLNWNELIMVFNSPLGWNQGAIQSIGTLPAGIGSSVTNTLTWTFPTLITPQQPWAGYHIVWNAGPATSTGRASVFVDNLRIVAIPEPTVFVGAAAASLGLLIRRRAAAV